MSTVQRLAKNTSLLMFSQISSFIIAFIYTVYMARYLGVEDFGLLSFALALISIIGIFADLGLNTLMTRELSRDKFLTRKYVNNIFSVKLVLLSVLLIATALIINLLGYPQKTIYVIYFIVLSLISTTFSGTFYSLFQAYENLKYQSIGGILNSGLMLIGVLIVVYYKLSVVEFALLYLIVGMIVLVYCLYITSIDFIMPKIGDDWDFDKEMIKLALQFGLIGIFSTVYVWIDSLMLFFMQGNQAVGLYNVAYRIVLVLLFIPIVINTAIFPVMSRMYGKSGKLKKIVEKYFKLMLLIGIPLGVGGTLLSNKIILLIFGVEYAGSIPALQILIWATVCTFANAAFVQLFQSTNKQMLVTKVTGIGMVENIILNLAIIPTFSYIGASINTLITEFTVAILLIIAANKTRYAFKGKKFLEDITKITASSLIMGSFIWLFKDLNLFILIVTSILIYIIVLYTLGVIDKEDKEIILKIMN